MPSFKPFKFAVLSTLASALWGTGPAALAHTTIKEPAMEGSNSYNAIVISHGCAHPTTGKRLPVVAQSVVIPTVNPIVTGENGNPTTLGDEFQIKDHTGAVSRLDSLANVVQLIQDKNVFSKMVEKTDANGNTIGYYAKKGKLDPTLYGLIPIRVSGITFNADKCARSLKIKIAIADVCKMKFPPKDGTVDLWIPNATPKFPDGNIDGSSPNPLGGAPATLTINRQELPGSCGEGYDVTVWPSNEDVDANLPFPGWR